MSNWAFAWRLARRELDWRFRGLRLLVACLFLGVGALAAIVASYKGLTAGGGPKGVGDAVNQSVVITFMLLFVANFVMTAIYFQVIPQKGM